MNSKLDSWPKYHCMMHPCLYGWMRADAMIATIEGSMATACEEFLHVTIACLSMALATLLYQQFQQQEYMMCTQPRATRTERGLPSSCRTHFSQSSCHNGTNPHSMVIMDYASIHHVDEIADLIETQAGAKLLPPSILSRFREYLVKPKLSRY